MFSSMARHPFLLALLIALFVASVASKRFPAVAINLNQIHVEAVALNKKLSTNDHIHKDAKITDIAQLENHIAVKKATQEWSRYERYRGRDITMRQVVAGSPSITPPPSPPSITPPPSPPSITPPPSPPSTAPPPPSPPSITPPPSPPSAPPPSPTLASPPPTPPTAPAPSPSSARPPSPLSSPPAVPPSPTHATPPALPPSHPPRHPPPQSNKARYLKALKKTMTYYMIQRAGKIPENYPVTWVYTSLLTDPVQPGFYDGGDTLKLNFPLSGSVSFLAWGFVDLHDTYQNHGVLNQAREVVRPAVEYLLNSYIGYRQYVGQISEPDVDHQFWGRPSQYPINKLPRHPFVWNQTTKHQADLLGSVAAALASSSMAYRDIDHAFATNLKEKAIEIWKWGTESEGLYSSVHPVATKAYRSSDWADDMAWGAAWLYRATGDRAYLDAALNYWKKQDPNPYACWDSKWAPTAAMLVSLSDTGIDIPGITTYRTWLNDTFLRTWLVADGFWSVIRTPKGLTLPSWSKWSNLRYANTAGMVVAMHALTNPDQKQKAEEIAYAKSQIDYALGSSGRSFVSGFDPDYPVKIHHAAASCPDMPDTCDWAQYASPHPNPQILTGGLVGGPGGPAVNPADPDAFSDERTNSDGNQVAVDHVSAFTTVLASVLDHL